MAGRGAGLSDWEWCVCEDIFPPRREQIAAVAPRRVPLIFLGDFNCTPTHDAYARR